MRDPNPDESLDAEGIPDLVEQPPGIDVETELEGIMAPRDHSIAAGSDPAYPVTAAEQRRPEPVGRRAQRAQPDFGEPPRRRRHPASPVATGEGGFLSADAGTPDDEDQEIADLAEPDDRWALSPEEAAMHIGGEDLADDVDPALERAEYLEP